MARLSSSGYQDENGLERAIIDLVRVGTQGHAAGVKQLASRLMRSVPTEVKDPESFRNEVHNAIAAGLRNTEMRYTPGTAPTERDSTQSLVDVDLAPDGNGLVLNNDLMSNLNEILLERQRADELRMAGVTPTRTLLLSGPPGVGKSMTARWFAQMLQLPLLTLDLSSVVSSYLGTSGRNIKSVLDYAKSGPCVLFLDEFDAIAKRRDDDADIGELKRIVNVILVELDRWPDTSLLIAATNHPQLLDIAVERRFDRSLVFDLPDSHQRLAILERLAADAPTTGQEILKLTAELTTGMTSSDLTRLWMLARRRAILHDTATSAELAKELARLTPQPGNQRDRLFLRLHDLLEMSNRQIAEITGLSHPTVSAGIRRAREAHYV